MRVPRVKFTITRALYVVFVIILFLPGFFGERISPGGWLSWMLITIGLASPLLLLLYLLAEVLTPGWHRGEPGPRAIRTLRSLRCPQFTLFQLILAMAILATMCWFAVMVVPLWWEAFHGPTDAEMAERFRLDAARWSRLAAENPGLAKEYQRLAERSIRAAERRERRAKVSRP
jgi:hypothetical protein